MEFMSAGAQDGAGDGAAAAGKAGGPMGLIAGQGRLPILVARGMRERGQRVCTIGLAGQYEPEVPVLSDEFYEVGILRLGQWIRRLRRMGVREAVMIGRVDKARLMHDRFPLLRRLPDWRTISLWYRRLRKDRRSPAVLAAVADELARGGVRLIDSTLHIPEHMATEGVMTRRRPTAQQLADIEFGWPVFEELLRLDVGQAIAVRERDVVAVEALEGTDRMIRRCGELCPRGGWVLLKGARSDFDRRADVPTIGEPTIRGLHAAGGGCIAVAAGDVIIVDKPETLALADKLGVSIVGVRRRGRA